MRASILYTIIFILTLSNPVLGQEKRVWNNQSEIYERLNYHRQNLNEDSAIYYVDELVQFQYEQQEDKSLGKVGPNITKIDVLILFKRYDEALELALSSMESCEKSLSPRNCYPCSRTFLDLADLMIILQDYRQGIAYLDKTCEEQKKGNYYYKKAKCFGLLEKPDSAFAITKKWITIVKESGKEKDLIPAYNQHGIIARGLKKFDIAIIAFSKAIEIIKTNELKMSRYAFIMGNLGACYQKLGEFDKAYACLLIDSEGSVNERNKDSYINAELALSQIDKVRKDYAVLINRLTNLLVNYDKNLLPNQKLTVIEMLMDAYKVTGNKKALSIYSNLWIKLNKEFYLSYVETYKKMMAQQTINTLNQVTQKMELEKQLKDQELIALKNETDKKRFKLFLLTMGLVMIIGVVLFLFWRFRMLQTKKNIIKEAELTLAIKEQEFIGKDLNNVVTNLSYKRKFIDEIQDKLKGLKEQPDEQLKSNLTLLIREFTNYKNADKGVEVLQADIDKVNLSFFNKLGEKFPLLTENEKELCGLFLLKLSTKDIAIIRNITPNAIKKARQRIRKKLPISESENITTFLNQL